MSTNARKASERRRSPSPRAQPAPTGPLEALRQEHIGKLLLLSSRIFERQAMAEMRRLGFDDLRLTHLALIRATPLEGARTTEIAEIAGMTKQAVGQLAMELEDAGYIVRLPDPTDGRAKLVRFADRGQQLLAALPQVLLGAEAYVESLVGAADLISLRRILRQLIREAS